MEKIGRYFKLKNLLFIGTAFLFLSGCSTLRTNQLSAPLNASIVAEPIKVNYEVGEKIMGSASGTILFGFLTLGYPDKYADGIVYNNQGSYSNEDYADLKAAAAYEAVKNSKADVIIAPKYEIEYKKFLFFKTVNVTVAGYRGTVKSIK
jgi:ABC-type amino acid transport substrate-binding protein